MGSDAGSRAARRAESNHPGQADGAMGEDRARSRADGSSARRTRANRPGRTFFAGQRHRVARRTTSRMFSCTCPSCTSARFIWMWRAWTRTCRCKQGWRTWWSSPPGSMCTWGKVELDIKDVEAKALLKVRLENLYNILDRALTTVERNPEILQGLLSTAGTAVESVGQTAQQAVQPGGAVSSLTEGVAAAGREALGPGGVATEAVASAGRVAEEAVGPGGAASKAAEGVTDTTSHAAQVGGAVTEVRARGCGRGRPCRRAWRRRNVRGDPGYTPQRASPTRIRHAAAPGSRQPGRALAAPDLLAG